MYPTHDDTTATTTTRRLAKHLLLMHMQHSIKKKRRSAGNSGNAVSQVPKTPLCCTRNVRLGLIKVASDPQRILMCFCVYSKCIPLVKGEGYVKILNAQHGMNFSTLGPLYITPSGSPRVNLCLSCPSRVFLARHGRRPPWAPGAARMCAPAAGEVFPTHYCLQVDGSYDREDIRARVAAGPATTASDYLQRVR